MASSTPTMATSRDNRWWLPEFENTRADRISDVGIQLWRGLEQTRNSMATAWRLYSNLPIIGLTPRLYRSRAPTSRLNRLSLNLVASVVDTYVSLITKDRPKMSFETSGGDWAIQRKAKLIEKFIDGILYDTQLNELSIQIVRDSAIFGVGIVKLYADEDNQKDPHIKIERILPWEILVDDQEAVYGRPVNLYHVRWLDRLALMEEFPEKATELATASSSAFMDGSSADTYGVANLMDWCVVVEAWHLPRSPGTKKDGGSGDGRHTLVCGNVILEDEVWERNEFPFEILYRSKPVQGIWGQSLPDQLAPLQVEINRLMLLISRAMKLAVGHWLVEQNSEVNTNAINDVVASIIRYTGTPPQFETANNVAPEVYAHLDRLWSRGFEVVGISQMAAQSQKPAGLNSGKAMLVYADVQSQRFQPCYHEYQFWNMNITKQILTLAREISDRHPSFEIKSTGAKQMMRAVRWADANLTDEEFTLKLMPTNQLADDPAAKLQFIQDMINAKMISPEDGKRLLDMPDLESFESYENASYNNIMMAATLMIEEGEYFPPEPYMNLPDAVLRMQQVYLKARIDRVPEERLNLIRRWIDAAIAEQAPPPPPPPPLGPPPGAPDAGMAPPGPPGPGGPPPPPGGPMPVAERVQTDIDRGLASKTAKNLS